MQIVNFSVVKRLVFLFIVTTVCFGCNVPSIIQTTVPSYPPHPLEPGKMIIANAFDVKSQSYRDSKEGQFLTLIEENKGSLANLLESHCEVAIEPGLFALAVNPDSCVQVLLRTHEATHAIIVTSFNAFFDQTDVVVTKDENGKSREAFYDIVVETNYSMSSGNLQFDTLISARKFHSSRSVVSGLLAAGPSIVSNYADAVKGVRANADMYAKCFFPGQDIRSRKLYVRKEFDAVGKAFDRSDYEAAFAASEKLADAKDRKIAAQAYYNCAVLLEKMRDFEKVKVYLLESMSRQATLEAEVMLEDYRFQVR